MRTIIINGRVGNDAQVKVGKNGEEYLSFRFANNEFDEKDASGNLLTAWYTVTINTPRLMKMKEYIRKGKPLNIIGHYSDSIYLNEKTGRYEIGRKIIAHSIDFELSKPMTGTGQDGTSYQGGQQYYGQPAAQPTPTQIPQVQMGTPAPQQAQAAPEPIPYAASPMSDDDLPF